MRYLSRSLATVAACSLLLAAGVAEAAGKVPGHLKKNARGSTPPVFPTGACVVTDPGL